MTKGDTYMLISSTGKKDLVGVIDFGNDFNVLGRILIPPV
jgi:hypothetical protein